jgi:hypothetical protein
MIPLIYPKECKSVFNRHLYTNRCSWQHFSQ